MRIAISCFALPVDGRPARRAMKLLARRNRFDGEAISPNRMILHKLRPGNLFSILIISVSWSVCASLLCSGVNCGDMFTGAALTPAGPAAAAVLTMAGLATRHDAQAVRQNFGSNEAAAAESSGEQAKTPTIVIGFVGGFVRRDNAVHSPVQIAVRLRSAGLSGVHVEVFENHRRQDAYRKVLQLLDHHPLRERLIRKIVVVFSVAIGTPIRVPRDGRFVIFNRRGPRGNH